MIVLLNGLRYNNMIERDSFVLYKGRNDRVEIADLGHTITRKREGRFK